MDGSEASLTGQYYQGEDEDQGWMSWAWSFVPAIVSAEDEEGESESGFYTESQEAGAARPLHKSPRDPVVSVGFYCTKASVTFKVRKKYCQTTSHDKDRRGFYIWSGFVCSSRRAALRAVTTVRRS